MPYRAKIKKIINKVREIYFIFEYIMLYYL